MIKTIPVEAILLNKALTAKGFSKEKPFTLKKHVKVELIYECPGKYEHHFPFKVKNIFPENSTITIEGKSANDIHYKNGKETFSWIHKVEPIEDWSPEQKKLEEDPWCEFVYWDLKDLLKTVFDKLSVPITGDYYTISTNDLSFGERTIHVNGYLWYYDGRWVHTEATWFVVPLKKFIEEYANRGVEYTDTCYEMVKQYQTDLQSEKEALDLTRKYFNGHSADGLLPFGEISMDTPDGNYINIV